ncbi:uncharacterized protein LOC119375903, partial [Rhipicephalus sanguineus]|uniref:uncharacterized protein LOC119375903 n=1 Tax=Rhipicephalus sanguineus TaxID=34632 RepID=UPI001894ECEA
VPTYSGYGDLLSARDYLDSLSRYQRAMGLDDQEVLGRVVPAALTDTAARWYRLAGYRAATLEEFRAAFLREFLPADYESRMRRELELRTQAPDESLQEYVRAMDDLFSIAEPRASNEERVERVIRQAHPTFSAYLRGGRFRDLEELAAEAKRIQGDLLAARAYRPPPPASDALEPRCAWRGAVPQQKSHGAAFAAASGCALDQALGRPGALLKPRSMLILDSFRGHITDRVKEAVVDSGCELVIIPGGLTLILQPLDVALNKQFKDRMCAFCNE